MLHLTWMDMSNGLVALRQQTASNNFSGDKKMIRLLLTLAVLAASSAVAGQAPKLNIDPERITVSGISAGGQMAHQIHVAYSDLFSGAAIIAGGPFGCADGSLATAMARCMGTADDAFPVAEQAAAIRAAAEEGRLASTDVLADDPVWLYHGTLDTTVAAGVSDALAALYAEFVPAGQIRYVKNVESGHAFAAQGRGSECNTMQAPFVADCDYDSAGELLQHLYRELKAPGAEVETDMTEVILADAAAAGLSETAYLFIPPACAGGQQACALHLVLHGCAQSAAQVGADFIQQSGYLPWAEANDIVLAFPQVVSGPLNPLACWDWWGYTGAGYLYRDSAQMAVLADWINGLQGKTALNDDY
jgi:poly(3-hydroxybutyrate) depolymerase